MDFAKKLSFLVFALCVLVSLKNQNTQINILSNKYSAKIQGFHIHKLFNLTESKIDISNATSFDRIQTLRYDYYNDSCPSAEAIVRNTVLDAYKDQPDIAPAMLRLFFHDCFVEGCDASLLLDATEETESEKQATPNESLKGYDLIDTIKFKLEEACPGVVSCADLLVLAARESVVLTGGPFYPLHTGRRDSTASFPDLAEEEIPSPQDDLSKAIELFAAKGFDERETVSLLGAHSIGMVHCNFFINRLFNFRETGEADPTMDPEFLNLLRSKCGQSLASFSPSTSAPLSSPSAQPEAPSSLLSFNRPMSSNLQDVEPGMRMDYEGPGSGFGTIYYRSLLQGKGLLHLDQQLTSGEETDTWVKAYASDVSLFQKDFTHTMIKLSSFRVLTGPMGQVRSNCRELKS